MNKNIKKPDLSKIHKVNVDGKNCLENYFGKKYIQSKIDAAENSDKSNSIINSNTFSSFNIVKENAPIYTSINSISDLIEQKNNIIDKYNKLVNEYGELLDRVEDQLDDNTMDSLGIIEKLLINRKKKIDSAFQKFIVDDSWDTAKIKDEFSHLLVKVIKDILESTSISISNGLKQNNIYEDIIKILNAFYSYLGIYTKEYKVGEVINDDNDWNNINTSQDDEIKDDKSYQNKIKSVESLAYLFDEDVVVLEANVVIWRIS